MNEERKRDVAKDPLLRDVVRIEPRQDGKVGRRGSLARRVTELELENPLERTDKGYPITQEE